MAFWIGKGSDTLDIGDIFNGSKTSLFIVWLFVTSLVEGNAKSVTWGSLLVTGNISDWIWTKLTGNSSFGIDVISVVLLAVP